MHLQFSSHIILGSTWKLKSKVRVRFVGLGTAFTISHLDSHAAEKATKAALLLVSRQIEALSFPG